MGILRGDEIRKCACYLSLQNPLSSHLLHKNYNIKIHRIIILTVVVYVCETWSITMREEHMLRVFENRVLRRFVDLTGGNDRRLEKAA
jgi:hypothetical protein